MHIVRSVNRPCSHVGTVYWLKDCKFNWDNSINKKTVKSLSAFQENIP